MGLSATVHNNMDDIDAVLVSPNGTAVFLLSDACGGLQTIHPFTISDSGATFLSDGGPCATGTYKPTNWDGPPESYFAPGPTGAQQVNSLAAFNGGPATGVWNLFAQDDNSAAATHGSFGGWSITMDITPPAPAPPDTGTTPPPANTGTPTVRCKKKKHKSAAAAKKCKKKKK